MVNPIEYVFAIKSLILFHGINGKLLISEIETKHSGFGEFHCHPETLPNFLLGKKKEMTF